MVLPAQRLEIAPKQEQNRNKTNKDIDIRGNMQDSGLSSACNMRASILNHLSGHPFQVTQAKKPTFAPHKFFGWRL